MGAWDAHRPRAGRGEPRPRRPSRPWAHPDVEPEGHRLRAATGRAKARWLRQAALEVCVTGDSPQRAPPVTGSRIRTTEFEQCRKPSLLTPGQAARQRGDSQMRRDVRVLGRRAGQAWASRCWLCGAAPGCVPRAWVAFSSKGLLSSWASGSGWWWPRHRCCRPPSTAARK